MKIEVSFYGEYILRNVFELKELIKTLSQIKDLKKIFRFQNVKIIESFRALFSFIRYDENFDFFIFLYQSIRFKKLINIICKTL